MDATVRDAVVPAALSRWGRVALWVVGGAAALNWVGWSLQIESLTRIRPSWPHMTPWTALWLALLAAAVASRLEGRSPRLRLAGLVAAVFVGLSSAAVLAEYLTGRSLGIDLLWFGDAMRAAQPPPWAGRPSPQTTTSVALLAMAIAVPDSEHRRAEVAWFATLTGGALIPAVSVAAYLFDATAMVAITSTTGQALPTAIGLLLVAAAAAAARPERLPLRWLLARPDRQQLTLLGVVFGAFPVVVASCRALLKTCHAGDRVVWTVSIAVGTAAVGALTFYLSQHAQRLLIEKEMLSRQRALAEHQYRLLADNAVDMVLHLRGSEIAWASPSVDAALGEPHQQWVGSDFRDRIHPDDLDETVKAWRRIVDGEYVAHRFQVRSGDGIYHWVDGHGKRYLDGDGNIDGIIAALRIIDDQVEIERRLERLARFDTVTGLVNRAEAIRRLEMELHAEQPPGTYVGILFCDVDHFKQVNDTWGHAVGDAVLAALAQRIVECVRPQDTVGRTGGDEIIVVLPGIRSLDDAAATAAKIRRHAAQPIVAAGHVVQTTVSIGAAVAADGELVTSIVARADAAMYQAKLTRDNTTVSTLVVDEVEEATSA